MLIDITLKNWKSYRETTTFSMVATRERQHKETLRPVNCLRTSLLSTAAVFGKNAAGKSNLFQALAFCKWFITRSTQTPSAPILVNPFLFKSGTQEQPSEFSFSLLINNIKWNYTFAATTTRVIKEQLECSAKKKGLIAYTREYCAEQDDYVFTYGSALDGNKDLLDLIARTTRPNQLFLTTSIFHNIKFFEPVFHWFYHSLRLISPIDTFSRLDLFTDDIQPSVEHFNAMLEEFQTGITRLKRKRVDLSQLPLPSVHLEQISHDLPEGKVVRLGCNGKRLPFVLMKQNGELIAEELVAVHKLNGTESEVDLPLNEESDGTRRIIDLLPVLMNLEDPNFECVYAIDELDRCLHSSATAKFLKKFRDSRAASKSSQLLFTTHDLQLMDQANLRRDEIWVVSRDMKQETSQIRRFSEIPNLRKDKTLLKSYLDGIFEQSLFPEAIK